MKILSAQQLQQWDAYTIANEPVASIDLMERAAKQCTDFIISKGWTTSPVTIFCGKGNNGGDGLAIARQLIQNGFHPSVYIIEFGAKGTSDFQANLQRLHELTKEIYFIQSSEYFPSIDKTTLVIDALYGSGLNSHLKDLSAQLVQHINQSVAMVVSIDVPSGMPLDKTCVGDVVIKASYTLTFQCLKLCFLIPENATFFGEVEVLDIGLLPGFPENIETTFSLTTGNIAASLYKPHASFANKGDFGHALLIAGNEGKMGAAIIASLACLRSGVGLLSVSTPQKMIPIIQVAVPEAMCEIREETRNFEKYITIGIGPGLGKSESTSRMLQQLFQYPSIKLVIDADAINVLAEQKGWIYNIQKDSVITPHPKEFDRLFGKMNNDYDRVNKAIAMSEQYALVIVLKGHYTLIAYKGKGYFNTTGNVGMATGGSGDMLTGVITSLIAQDYSSFDAAVLGVYLHGLSADLSLVDESYESLLPMDMIKNLGKAFKQLSEVKDTSDFRNIKLRM